MLYEVITPLPVLMQKRSPVDAEQPLAGLADEGDPQIGVQNQATYPKLVEQADQIPLALAQFLQGAGRPLP